MLIPWAIPTVVSARLWEYMYNGNYGVINDMLVNKLPQLVDWIPVIGDNLASLFPENPIPFTARPNWAMPAIIAVDVWKTTPFMALLILAGLQIIPGDVYEASTVDGASKWQQFWQITLPLLRPGAAGRADLPHARCLPRLRRHLRHERRRDRDRCRWRSTPNKRSSTKTG